MTDAPSYNRAVSWVLAWCRWYTRRLDWSVADERRTELRSDLHEHGYWADSVGRSATVTSTEVLSRAICGIVADLSWRRSVLTADRVRGARFDRAVRGCLQAAVRLTALAVAGAGAYALSRVLPVELANAGVLSVNTAMLAALTGLAVMGLVLLLRRRTRLVGALWMIFASFGLIHSAYYGLTTVSVTFGYLYPAPSDPHNLARLFLRLGLAALFAAAAVLWAPTITTLNAASRRNKAG